ncbi:MAG TPA: hypothetical protein VM580_21075 [Labilithrix sp.]|jgi:hypothetical protein|nr:hypothetical protein [Labilithrix sp.]
MTAHDKGAELNDPPRVVWLAFDSPDDDMPFAFPSEDQASKYAENERVHFGRIVHVAGPYVLAEPSFVEGGA